MFQLIILVVFRLYQFRECGLSNLVEKYENLLLVPYVNLGRNPSNGLDCFGLIKYIIENEKRIELPDADYDLSTKDTSEILDEHKNEISDFVYPIEIDNIQPLDIIVMKVPYSKLKRHVGIYLGNGIVIHASRPRVITHRLDRIKKLILTVYRLKDDQSINTHRQTK